MNASKLICFLLFCLIGYNKTSAHTAWQPMAGDTGLYKHTYCSLLPVLINNNPYNPMHPSGLEKIPNGAFNGQDSFFRVELIFTEPSVNLYSPTICETDTIYVNGQPYHAFKGSGIEIIPSGAASGCDSIIKVNLNILPSPYAILRDTLCPEATFTLNGEIFDRSRPAGIIVLPNASFRGCDSIINVSLDFRETWVYAGPDRYVIEGDSVCTRITAKYPPKSIVWTPVPPCGSPGCIAFCMDSLLNDQQYHLDYIDQYGCILKDDLYIGVKTEHEIFAPNVFRINADRPNDHFFIRADAGIKIIRRLMIFDRWGEPVFVADQLPNDDSAYNKGWDGTWRDKEVEQGVYGWWAEFEVFNGRVFTESGTVTVLKQGL